MEDNDILALYQCRSQNALDETSRKYGTLCKNTAMALLGSPQDAEECVNDTLMRLWERIPPANPKNLGGYCVAVCRSIAIDRRRRETAEKRGGGEIQLCIHELENYITSADRPDEMTDRRALGEAISRFLDTLPAEQRVMFVLRYWSCLDVKEVARQCGCGVSKVKMSLARTRKKLRAALEEEGYL